MRHGKEDSRSRSRNCPHSRATSNKPCIARSRSPMSGATNMRRSSISCWRSIDDQDAAAVMRACNVDLEQLKANLTDYIDTELKNLAGSGREESKPTAGFQRVIQRAMIHVQSSGREEVTGANVLVAIFAERESHAAYFLQEQDMTRYDAVNYISHGIAKRAGASDSRPPKGADQEREERGETGGGEGQGRPLEEERGAAGLLRQPQQEGDRRQDRSPDRPRARGAAHHPGPVPAPEEQPAPRRRSRRRQDRDRRGPRAQDRARRGARSAARRDRLLARHGDACSPARAIAAISRNASSRSSRRSRPIPRPSCSSTRSTR